MFVTFFLTLEYKEGMKSNIQNKVMRRVYYSFALSFVEQPMLWAGVARGGAVALFGRLTHVAAIGHNLASVPVGAVPKYITNSFSSAVARGEFGTVLTVLAIASLSAVAIYQLSRVHVEFRVRWAH